MKQWWKEHWYGALVILIVGGILLYCWGYNNRSIEGILVKIDSGELYLLETQETYDAWGRINFTLHGRPLHLEKFYTGDRVKLKGDISILESWPRQYADVSNIAKDKKYDEESLQIVRDVVQRLENGYPWDGLVIYPE